MYLIIAKRKYRERFPSWKLYVSARFCFWNPSISLVLINIKKLVKSLIKYRSFSLSSLIFKSAPQT